jgi:hypothetical protein
MSVDPNDLDRALDKIVPRLREMALDALNGTAETRRTAVVIGDGGRGEGKASVVWEPHGERRATGKEVEPDAEHEVLLVVLSKSLAQRSGLDTSPDPPADLCVWDPTTGIRHCTTL